MDLRPRLAWATLLAALVLAAPALAQSAAPSPDAKERAKLLLTHGNDAFKKGDYAAALRDFQGAYAAFPSAKILLNVGQTFKELKQYDAAADAFSSFLANASADTTVSDASVEAARSALRELDAQVVAVHTDVTPRGAALTLDGRAVPADFHLLRSEDPHLGHILHATSPGFEPADATVTLSDALKWAASHQSLPLALKPVESTIVAVPAPEPAPQPKPPNVAPTPTQLAQNDAATTPKPQPEVGAPAPSANHTPAIVAFAVAGAAAVGASAFGIMALSQNGKLTCGSSGNPCTDDAANTASSARNDARIADLLWLGAAVAGGTGAVLWFVAPGSDGAGGEVGLVGRF